jgi:hypothetical protein
MRSSNKVRHGVSGLGLFRASSLFRGRETLPPCTPLWLPRYRAVAIRFRTVPSHKLDPLAGIEPRTSMRCTSRDQAMVEEMQANQTARGKENVGEQEDIPADSILPGAGVFAQTVFKKLCTVLKSIYTRLAPVSARVLQAAGLPRARLTSPSSSTAGAKHSAQVTKRRHGAHQI